MGFYAPDSFFMDLIEEIRLIGHLRTLSISSSHDNEVLCFHHTKMEDLDARVVTYVSDRGFVEESRVESAQHCLKIFRTTQSFCACSRIFDPIYNDWWYSILLSGKPNTQDNSSGSSVFGAIK